LSRSRGGIDISAAAVRIATNPIPTSITTMAIARPVSVFGVKSP
jgi:hypothetical protein